MQSPACETVPHPETRRLAGSCVCKRMPGRRKAARHFDARLESISRVCRKGYTARTDRPERAGYRGDRPLIARPALCTAAGFRWALHAGSNRMDFPIQKEGLRTAITCGFRRVLSAVFRQPADTLSALQAPLRPNLRYSAGTTNRFSSVDVTRPPKITTASGCSIS